MSPVIHQPGDRPAMRRPAATSPAINAGMYGARRSERPERLMLIFAAMTAARPSATSPVIHHAGRDSPDPEAERDQAEDDRRDEARHDARAYS